MIRSHEDYKSETKTVFEEKGEERGVLAFIVEQIATSHCTPNFDDSRKQRHDIRCRNVKY